MARSIVLLAALLLVPAAATAVSSRAHALERDAATDFKSRPVMKVVRLLQDMQAELQHDLEDDKAVHEQLDCWCKTNDKEKTKAIELGEAKEAQLESFLGEAAAKMKEMKTKRDATLDEVDKDYNALKEAEALRMKENQAFHAEQVNLIEAVKASDQALVALGKHKSAMPEFQQVKAAARHLEAAKVLSLTTISPQKLAALKAFLNGAQGKSSFLAIPGMQSYAPQSGQIFGILKQMKEDFEVNLSDAQAAEKKSIKEYEMLKAAKEDEIATAEKLIIKLDADIAEFTEKHAQAASELEDTEKQLADDTEFLAALDSKCASAEAEFQARTKARNEEISAVDDTIGYLNSDEAYAVFDKTVNTAATSNAYSATDFLQISAMSAVQERERRQQASALLNSAAAQM